MKPIVEIMWADFLFVAIDQLINQASNARFISGGAVNLPMVVRTQQGATPGSCAQHSQSIEAILAHIPGVKVALAATAADAYALLRAAAADPDPCLGIEARKFYMSKGEVAITAEAEPVGKARLRRKGTDASILTWGTMVPVALEAAEVLCADGVEVGVLDLRWLNRSMKMPWSKPSARPAARWLSSTRRYALAALPAKSPCGSTRRYQTWVSGYAGSPPRHPHSSEPRAAGRTDPRHEGYRRRGKGCDRAIARGVLGRGR